MTDGETASSILEFLGAVSLTGMPQPLEYLIESTATRHGLVRVQRRCGHRQDTRREPRTRAPRHDRRRSGAATARTRPRRRRPDLAGRARCRLLVARRRPLPGRRARLRRAAPSRCIAAPARPAALSDADPVQTYARLIASAARRAQHRGRSGVARPRARAGRPRPRRDPRRGEDAGRQRARADPRGERARRRSPARARPSGRHRADASGLEHRQRAASVLTPAPPCRRDAG